MLPDNDISDNTDKDRLRVLLEPYEPALVISEIDTIVRLIHPHIDREWITRVFYDIVSLFRGWWPDYRSYTTPYHDLRHTMGTTLAMARLLHGAVVVGERFTRRDVHLGLISALVHDTGYLQRIYEDVGTGAKYSRNHVERSIVFARECRWRLGLSSTDLDYCELNLLCTDLSTDIKSLPFGDKRERFSIH